MQFATPFFLLTLCIVVTVVSVTPPCDAVQVQTRSFLQEVDNTAIATAANNVIFSFCLVFGFYDLSAKVRFFLNEQNI